MKLEIYEVFGEKHIFISGNNFSEKDSQMFINELDKCESQAVSITVLDSYMLPRSIIEKLYCVNKTINCKIYIFKRYLYSYLSGLGIKSKLNNYSRIKYKTALEINKELLDRQELQQFLKAVNLRYGFDYTGYDEESIIRRIRSFMVKESIGGFDTFSKLILKEKSFFEQLFLEFSINTTKFFRDAKVFRSLRMEILPELKSFSHIKLWCVGCSNGKEAYSLAIVLEELGLLHKTQIYATDINPYVIEEAKNGLFSMDNIEEDIINYKESGGAKSFVEYFYLKENYMKVKESLKNKVLFFQHNLVDEGIIDQFHLILCRNVLIYFKPQLQGKIIKDFYNSLGKKGFLVLGKGEGLLLNGGEQYFRRYMKKERIYMIK